MFLLAARFIARQENWLFANKPKIKPYFLQKKRENIDTFMTDLSNLTYYLCFDS